MNKAIVCVLTLMAGLCLGTLIDWYRAHSPAGRDQVQIGAEAGRGSVTLDQGALRAMVREELALALKTQQDLDTGGAIVRVRRDRGPML